MTVADFIKVCSRGINDYGLHVIQPQEWFDILNFQSADLYPEIGYRGTKTGTVTDLHTASSEYQLDLSDQTGIDNVKEVFVIDSNGDSFPFANWIYYKETKILDLDPMASRSPDRVIINYTSYKVIWFGFMPSFLKTTNTISLDGPKLSILKSVCIKEALRRILNDHAKLDRYRTLVGRMNEYAMMAMIDRLTTEIELNKRKLVDTHSVRSY